MSDIVACICEGSAEMAIIELLLDGGMLGFEKSDLLEGKLFKRMKAKMFCDNHLNRNFGERKVKIIRILDSMNEKFVTPFAYNKKVSTNECYYTRPEIEMLIIISEKKADDYNSKYKSDFMPSRYCKEILGIENVKAKSFVCEYFSDVHKLVDAIKEYRRIHKFKPNEKCLCDLLLG